MLYLATKAYQKRLKSNLIKAGIENVFYLLQRTALEGSDLKQFASGSKVASPVSTLLFGNLHWLQEWKKVSTLFSLVHHELKIESQGSKNTEEGSIIGNKLSCKSKIVGEVDHRS